MIKKSCFEPHIFHYLKRLWLKVSMLVIDSHMTSVTDGSHMTSGSRRLCGVKTADDGRCHPFAHRFSIDHPPPFSIARAGGGGVARESCDAVQQPTHSSASPRLIG
jgi:hypothetical protein